MNYFDKVITISGVHSFGGVHPENSGYKGKWRGHQMLDSVSSTTPK